MSISDADYLAWLRGRNRNAVILCQFNYVTEVAGAPVTATFYWADKPYIDYVEPRPYIDCINSVPSFNRSLSGDRFGAYSSSIGSLELDNADGAVDQVLSLAADGSRVDFYYGDVSWPVADFRLIFSALVARISAPSFDRLSVTLKDTGVLVNKSIGGDVLIGGDGPNADKFRPDSFGYIRQLECPVVSEANLTYAFAKGNTNLFVTATGFAQTVRDRGVPVAYTDNLDGTFDLVASPDGVITTDVLLALDGNAAHRCVSDSFRYFIEDVCGLGALGLYFGPGPTFDVRPDTGIDAYIDGGGEDVLIGVLVADKRNALDLLSEICDTGLCFWAILRTGEFTFGRIKPDDIASLAVSPVTSIIEDDFEKGSFQIDHALPTYYQISCVAARNWSQQQDLAGVLTPYERGALSRPGLAVTQYALAGINYAAAPQLYNLSLAISPEISTLLSSGNGDDSIEMARTRLWLDRRRSRFLPWIETISGLFGIEFYTVELGDVITLTVPRFDLDAGELVQVIGIDINLSSAKVGMKLLRRHLPGSVTSTPGDPITPTSTSTQGIPAGRKPPGTPEDPINPMPPIVTSGPGGVGGGGGGSVGGGGGGGPFAGPVGIVCAAGWNIQNAFSLASDIPSGNVFDNPYDIGPNNFAWAWDTRSLILLGTGMSVGTTVASDITWFAQIYGYFPEYSTGYEDGTVHSVDGGVFGLIQVYPKGLVGDGFFSSGGDNVLNGWELIVQCGRTFSPPAMSAPFFDVSFQPNTFSFILQAYKGVVAVCAPITYSQFDAYPIPGT